MWDGMIPALMSDVPGCSSTPASCGRYLFMSVQSPVFFLGPSTFLCTQMTCPCLADSEHCPKTWQASPKTWAAHLIVAFFPGCLKTWMLPMGQEVSCFPVKQGHTSRQKLMLPAGEVEGLMLEPCTSAHVTPNFPDISGS